ncbi:MAG TPA: hypothetical protein VF796_03270 [Humisphaera sp.]
MRWVGFALWLAVASATTWTWRQSHHTSDLVVLHLRDGTVHGVMSHRGGLLVATTTLSLGPGRALTADHLQDTLESGDPLFHGLYSGAGWLRSVGPVGLSAGHRGDVPELPDLAWSAAVVPHAGVAGVAGVMAAWCGWRGVLRMPGRRRRRAGRCPACGYDLRESAGGRCPECGAGEQP